MDHEDLLQLYRYFAVTNARIAVLTNGQVYQFYTDLDAPNKMDAKPFLVLDLLDIDETLIPELRKLTKEVFDLDSIINAAGELKYVGQIKRTIAAQFKEPEEEWIRFFTSRVYDGAITQKVREQFAPLVTKATKQFLNDQVNERLKTALGATNFAPSEIHTDTGDRKPIARLHFNSKKQKYIGLFDDQKVETRHPLDSLDDIYQHAAHIREAVKGLIA